MSIVEQEARRLEEWDNTPDIQELLSVLSDGDILEIGCGTGRIIEDLAESLTRSHFTGLDIQGYFIEIAQRKGISNAEFVEADALVNVFPPETFDYVIFRDSLHEIREHTGLSGVSISLRNAYSYLRPGGRIIIRDAVSHKLKKIKLELDQNMGEMFSLYVENSIDKVRYSETGEGILLDVADLTSFLGKRKKLEMNPELRFEKNKHFTVEEYDEILKETGFTQEEIRLYQFPPHLIPEGTTFDRDELPGTYCMLTYSK